MTKIHVADVRSQLLNAARANELVPAAGNNTLISKTEQKTLPADLQAAADEVRARKPGTTVSVDAVVAVVAEQFDRAVAGVNQPAGSGKPFLSRDEIANLQTRDSAMGARVQSAVDVLAPTAPSAIVANGADVHAQLASLVAPFFFDGLLGSEGGEPVSAVMLPAMSMSSGDALARAFGHDPTTELGHVERFHAPKAVLIKEFLEQQQAPAGDVARVGALLRGLDDLRVLVIGKDGGASVPANHPTYLVGTAKDGVVVGVRTGVIWT
ncbi:MAG: hypothetical protein Q8O67_18030 [Deltaproteobacteria bacterium]|nr:hypothetical protein [Deltaproteobacteria bacterium]